MFQQAAVVQHQFDDFLQRDLVRLFAHGVNLGHERGQIGPCLARHLLHGIHQGGVATACGILQLLQRARADAARREVDHAQKGGVVARVVQQAQIGQRVLDLRPFEEAQTTIDAIGNRVVEQRGFDHPALRVAAVENGNFLARAAVAHQLFDLVHDPLRFGQITGQLHHPHRFARALIGAQVLAETARVVADQRVRTVEDVAVTAVVLLQLDLVLHLQFGDEVVHVAHTRTAKGVDALVIVAHGKDGIAGNRVTHFGHKLLEPEVLQAVGILELVHQNVAEAALVMLAHQRMVAQDLVAAQHQLAEVHHALALALLLVQLVDIDFLAALGIAHRHIAGTLALLLATADEPLHLLGRKLVVVDVELLVQALDGRELVLRVEDLEALGQIRHLVVRAQKAVAQAVEGPDPHAAHVDGQHGRQARCHFLGGLVGKGHGHDAAGRHALLLQ